MTESKASSERKPGHRRRQREPGESRTPAPRADGVKCKALNKQGEPCKSPSVRADGYCNAHSSLPMANGEVFGSPEQTRTSATGVSKRYPKLTEIVEREIEAKAADIIQAHLEGLRASRLHVDAHGGEHEHPDHDTRWRAAAALLDRALGKPGPGDGEMANPNVSVNIALVTDPAMRERAAELRRSIAATRPGPSKFGPGA
jgi:hypothetical protein